MRRTTRGGEARLNTAITASSKGRLTLHSGSAGVCLPDSIGTSWTTQHSDDPQDSKTVHCRLRAALKPGTPGRQFMEKRGAWPEMEEMMQEPTGYKGDLVYVKAASIALV
jgi:hypothetical protein